MTSRSLLVFLALFFVCTLKIGVTLGQSQKADKWLNRGLLAELHHHPEKAIIYYKKGIQKAPSDPRLYQALGTLYQNQQEFESAGKIILDCKFCSNADKMQAAQNFLRAKDFVKTQNVLSELQQNPEFYRANKDALDRLQANLSFQLSYQGEKNDHDSAVNLGVRVNTRFDEYAPSVSLDDSVLLFTRNTNGMDPDFYQSVRDSCGEWLRDYVLPEPPNSPSSEGSAMLSADGHYLFFMRCENQSPNGWALGGCDLYFSYTEGHGWSQPVPFGGTINTPDFEGMPSLSPDNKVLYFVSNRSGGYGGMDIWMSEFVDGLWQVPVNLGPEINTPGDETSPWIAMDNQTLYFTSDGHPGFGGTDIFMAHKSEVGDWQTPINLGPAVNSSSDEKTFTVRNNGTEAYFSSNRAGGFGGFDLYRIDLPEALRPETRTFVYGQTRDSLSGRILPRTAITWTDVASGKRLAQYESNRGDASFISAFPPQVALAVEAVAFEYQTFRDTVSFDSVFIFPLDTFNISMLPSDYVPQTQVFQDTVLYTVRFPKNSVEVPVEDLNFLTSVIAPYLNRSDIQIVVNGFTDTSGYRAINEDISLRRALSVKDALVRLGFPTIQIEVHGWADNNPVAPNTTEWGRTQNRRAVIVLKQTGQDSH